MQIDRSHSPVPALSSNFNSVGSSVKHGLRVITFLALTKITEATNVECSETNTKKMTTLNENGPLEYILNFVKVFSILGAVLIVCVVFRDEAVENRRGNGWAPMGH